MKGTQYPDLRVPMASEGSPPRGGDTAEAAQSLTVSHGLCVWFLGAEHSPPIHSAQARWVPLHVGECWGRWQVLMCFWDECHLGAWTLVRFYRKL